jgi:protocatechuate 3,4-dioxygenase beta subunit
LTDGEVWYRFTSIKPGAYPWLNHHNAWRPNHVHFSFFGSGFTQRLVTQMYFPGDPLLALGPIFLSIPDEAARRPPRLRARHDGDRTRMGALLPLGRSAARPRGYTGGGLRMPAASSQTIGAFWHLIEHAEWADLTWFGAEGEHIVLTGTVIDVTAIK